MKASKFSDAQKAFILKQGADGVPVPDICKTVSDDSITTSPTPLFWTACTTSAEDDAASKCIIGSALTCLHVAAGLARVPVMKIATGRAVKASLLNSVR